MTGLELVAHIDCVVPKGSKRHFAIFTGET